MAGLELRTNDLKKHATEANRSEPTTLTKFRATGANENRPTQGNCIGPDGAAALAEALKVNTCLTRLYIDGAGIKAKGACAVASALVSNNAVLRYVRPERP